VRLHKAYNFRPSTSLAIVSIRVLSVVAACSQDEYYRNFSVTG
jgi:hypothetical protein